MRKSLVTTIAVALAATVSGAVQEKVDFSVIEKIKAEGMDRSKVLETFDQLTTVIGPRLTNSPAHKRAVAWTQETLKAWGMSEVHTEPFAVRARLDARQGVGRDDRTALHADDRLPERMVAVDGRTSRGHAGVAARPRGRRRQGAGRQAQGRHRHDEPGA